MLHKGLIDVRGSGESPLIQPYLSIDGQDTAWENVHWERKHYWIPSLTATIGGSDFHMEILTPIKERGFAVKLSFTSKHDSVIHWGLKGTWLSTWHCVNEDKEIEGSAHCYESGWNHSIIFDFRTGVPMFAFAPMCDHDTVPTFTKDAQIIRYQIDREDICHANQKNEIIFYWGLGFEEVAAATSAKEMLRRGWEWEYNRTAKWLDSRVSLMPTPKTTEIYNTNLFFSIFYSTGITLDTEELICATSRSTRYYVSAAYWDRDVLLWAFPAILDADENLAGEILQYIFGRQRRNLGIHSRYIDGTVLEPGFELDELVSPLIALNTYVQKSGNREILKEANIQAGISTILKRLAATKHDKIALYETFLQPTDDEIVYPYLTYNNVLVWKALTDLSYLMPETYGYLRESAEETRNAIYDNCIFNDEQGNPYFAWSVDLAGRHNVYDEPPGSLQLLPYYGFCSADDPVWLNTTAIIRSPDYTYSFADSPIAEIGCAHAPYPWILSLCNSLLSGHQEQAFKELEVLTMDNGIACESVDPVTGESVTGDAFATCAGFLCHSMYTAAKEGFHAL